MKKEDLQNYLDELYLLEQKSSERLEKLVVHSDQRRSSLHELEMNLKDLVAKQSGSVVRLERCLSETQTLHQKIVKWGGLLTVFVSLGLVCLFLGWWHVHSLLKEDKLVQEYIIYRSHHLPGMVQQGGKTYMRIATPDNITGLMGDDGQILDGEYIEVVLPDD